MSLKKYPSFLQNIFGMEMNTEAPHRYRFSSFTLDVDECLLLDDDRVIHLTPRAFDLLVYLVERRGHLVGKNELMEAIWPDAFVEEANLTRAIHTLRRVLNEGPDDRKFIETVAKKGYRFVADVSIDGETKDEFAANGNGNTDSAHVPIDIDNEGPARLEPDIRLAKSSFRPALLVGFALAVAGLLISFVAINRTNNQTSTKSGLVSIAVLPFRPVNSVNRDEAVELAFADELINQLSQLPDFEVRSFNTIRKYSTVDLDPAVIGKDQKVDFVLVSNFFVSGERVKGTSELYSVETGSVDATFPFEGTNVQMFALTESIASIIRSALLAKLNIEPFDVAKRGTSNEEAWRHYLLGFKLINKRTKTDAEKAVLEFENALRLDPTYAQGYIGLAQAHQTAVVNGAEPGAHCPQNLAAARRALELAPRLGDAHTGYGAALNFCADDRANAEISLRRAIELEPHSYYAHTYLGMFLTHRGGSTEESIEEIKKAIDLNPDLNWLQRMLGRAYFFAKRYDEAISRFETAWEIDPGEVEQALLISSAYELKGDFDRAFEWFTTAETAGGRGSDIEAWKTVYANAGWQGVLRKRFERAEALSKQNTNDYFEVVNTAVPLGETEKAFGYFEKACSKPGRFLNGSPVDPYLDPLRSDPRWGDVVSRCWKTGDDY